MSVGMKMHVKKVVFPYMNRGSMHQGYFMFYRL